jgi:hypothetical protein
MATGPIAASTAPHECGHCGAAGAALRCSRCKACWYCKKECQAAAWPLHKTRCAAAAGAAAAPPPLSRGPLQNPGKVLAAMTDERSAHETRARQYLGRLQDAIRTPGLGGGIALDGLFKRMLDRAEFQVRTCMAARVRA